MKQSLASRFKKTLLLSFITLSGAVAQSNVVLDQNPPSVKWRQINTPSFKIIYPRDFEDEAQRMANTMEHLYYPVSKTMGVTVRKLPIILQNQNSLSNGFVTVAPRRSEFYSMPPQDYNFLGSNDWLNLLAVHEYRHVVQYQRSETGWFIKVFKTVFGGDAWSFFTHVGVPSWFWEGDAVATETALTTSGRGRIPNFDLAFRTNLLENGGYNYHKQYLGSFRDFVPNYYVLGYHMVTHVRRNFDEKQWPNIFTRTFNNPYIPFNFSRSIKKETGYKLTTTYKHMLQEVDSLWKWQVDNLPVTESSKVVFRENTTFTNYDYPQFLSDGKLVALRTGISNIAQFVLIDSTTKAKKLHTLGQVNDAGMLSVGGDKIVWNEFRYNPRYSVKSYSVIKIYDYRKKSTKTLTRKSRLSGSAISHKGDKIVSIENATTGKNTIVILDATSGKELNRFDNQSNDFFAMPRWSDDGSHIVVLKTTKAGKTITQFSADGKTSKDLLPLSSENFGHPIQYGKYVIYNSPYSGIDNIYALDTESGLKYQITSKPYATYNPTISSDGKVMAFNNFTKLGMDVEVMPFEPSEWKPIENVEDRNVRYYEPLVEQEANAQVLNNVPNQKHESKKYSEFTHLFNPYSFYPILNPVDREFGGYINSQNLLGTMATQLGVSFNGNEGKPRAFAGISYQKFFPIIDIEAGVGARSVREEIGNTDEYSVNTWTENTIGIGTRIPLNLTTNKYLRGLTLGANGNYTIVSGHSDRDSYYEQANGELFWAEYSASFYSLLKRAHRDVTSRWGFSGFAIYRNTPLDLDYSGSLLGLQGKVQVPGFLKHDGFSIRIGYSEQDLTGGMENYRFSNPIFFPRGYSYTAYSTFYNGAVEYKFPIWNADLNHGSIVNFQRFKGRLFYDRGFGQRSTGDDHYESIGVELHTDFNILRWYPLIEIGVRWSYIPEYKSNIFDFLVFQFDL